MNPNNPTPTEAENNVPDGAQTLTHVHKSESGQISDTDMTALPDQSGTNPSASTSKTGDFSVPGGPTDTSGTTGGTIFGQYELIGEVARGGMGVVYKARQRGLGRLVALKMVLGFSQDNQAAIQRFILEAKSAASLDHPNVVPIYDSGEIDGKMYFTMALVEGPNLKGYVESHGVPPIPETVALFTQIVGGVAHAHQQGIIHRDLKPANVLMDKDGRPRVTDFGLAKQTSGHSELTGTGQVMGTPAYMPPEQARDSKDVGPPADVYSLGAILYFLLTGRPPFIGESVPDLLIKVVSEAPAPPSQINPEVPPELEAVCLRCLSKTPAERYPDARGLAEALLPVIDKYLPRSTPSLSSFPGRMSGMMPTASLSRSPVGGVGLTTASMSGGSLPPAPAAETKGKRTRLIALTAAAALLASIAVYLLVVRPPKKIENIPGTGPVASDGGAQSQGGTNSRTQGTTTSTPGEGEAESLAWPAMAHSDFGLSSEMVVAKPIVENGIVQLPNKTVLQLKLKADKNCKAAVFWIDPEGKVLQLFPNEFEKDGSLTAGKERIIPGGGGMEYELITNPTEGAGIERLRVIATTGDLPASLTSAKTLDGYAKYETKAERAKLVSHVRGIVLKKTGAVSGTAPQVADSEVRFRVTP